jgi:transposase
VQDGSGDATRLLGLDGLMVGVVALTPLGIRLVQLVTADPEAARCPACGQVSTSAKEWTLTQPRDLPVGGAPVLLQWRKRRWRCRTVDCPRESFTEQVPELPARARTTTRLRTRLATAVEDVRCPAEVAATFGVSWPTVQRAIVAHGRRALCCRPLPRLPKVTARYAEGLTVPALAREPRAHVRGWRSQPIPAARSSFARHL